nr:unnamed protein product [Spirometra erinaceieuropaei]
MHTEQARKLNHCYLMSSTDIEARIAGADPRHGRTGTDGNSLHLRSAETIVTASCGWTTSDYINNSSMEISSRVSTADEPSGQQSLQKNPFGPNVPTARQRLLFFTPTPAANSTETAAPVTADHTVAAPSPLITDIVRSAQPLRPPQRLGPPKPRHHTLPDGTTSDISSFTTINTSTPISNDVD